MSRNIDCVPIATLRNSARAEYPLSGDDNAVVDCVDDTVLMQCGPWSMFTELVLLLVFLHPAWSPSVKSGLRLMLSLERCEETRAS